MAPIYIGVASAAEVVASALLACVELADASSVGAIEDAFMMTVRVLVDVRPFWAVSVAAALVSIWTGDIGVTLLPGNDTVYRTAFNIQSSHRQNTEQHSPLTAAAGPAVWV